MRTKLIIVVALVVTLALMVVSPAMGAQQTRILYGLENEDYYTYTPTAAGYLQIQISWEDDAGGTPGYPVAEVDGVCQAFNIDEGEAYWDYDLGGLYASTNPEVDVLQVTADMVDEPVYVGVIPFVGDVPYRIILGWSTKQAGPFATVYDSGDINPATSPRAHGIDAKFYVPATAAASVPWHSVSIWPGSASGTQYADYDDYVWNYDYMKTIANNWASLNYYGPMVTDATISKAMSNDWYIAAPEVWTAAEVPNVWGSNILYPKPGTLAYNAAPLWYTYSWGEDAGTSKVAYLWGTVTSASASRLSYSADASTVAKIGYSFNGTSLTWVYRKGPLGGKANIYVDGSATPYNATPISMYSATAQWKQEYAITGLSNANHTIEIRNVGSTDSPGGGYYIYHDAFKAPGFSGDVHTQNENNMDGMTLYDWARANSASASGGNYGANASTASAAAFTFNNTSIKYIYRTGPLGGRVDVYIDGVLVDNDLDLYSASAVYNVSKTYSGLSSGWHTILLRNAGATSSPGGGYYVYLDAFDVGGTLYQN